MKRRRRRVVGAFGASVVASVLAFTSIWAWRVYHRPPNIIILQIDTLRADHVGCYGSARPTTPALDSFARDSVRFRNAYSVTSWTLPAVASLLTGLLPSHHGVRATGDLLPDGVPTLALLLRRNGYHTAAISANFAFVRPTDSYPKPPLHIGQGFQTFLVLSQQTNQSDGEAEPALGTLIRTVRADRVTAEVKTFLHATHAPFFLFAVYIDPHYGYEPPPKYAARFEPVPLLSHVTGSMRDVAQLAGPLADTDVTHLRNLYDGEVRYVDEHVGALLAAVEDAGLGANTIVVLLSDHGEEFADHGKMLHGQTLYEESIRVPLLIRGPGIPAGRVIEEPVSILDVMPTVLRRVGVAVPQGLDGRDVSGALQDPSTVAPRDVLFELDNELELVNGPRRHTRALREEGWKIITSLDGGMELYDLTNDPAEQHNLANIHPDIVTRLSGALAQQAPLPSSPPARPTLSTAEQERLRALGYGREPQ
jgi:arylsulfatase A-like enzyme